jgi:glycine dehydrogenase
LPAFASRHLGPQGDDLAKMLAEVGAASLDDLVAEVVPPEIRSGPLQLAAALDEDEVLVRLEQIAARNRPMINMIGRGYYGTRVPPVIARNVLESPAWYTAYTPYQAEISQGRLEVLLTFQTMVTDLTGMEIANASLLDEATAAAEAMAMCHRLATNDRKVFWVDEGCHPQTIAVMSTRAEPAGIEIRVGDPSAFEPGEAFGVLLQNPSTSGEVRDLSGIIEAAHAAGALVVVATDLLALAMLIPPGELGADIVVGSSQRFGVPLGFGGPHAAFFATREALVRAMPGRLVGVSRDSEGRMGYRLALQTREQHIRRERATSNVCTAQVLLAMMAALYGCWHGPEGLVEIATRVHRLTGRLAAGLEAAGFELVHETFFDTVTVRVPDAGAVITTAAEDGINLLRVGDSLVGVSCDETTTDRIIDRVLAAFGAEPAGEAGGIPNELIRHGPVLTHSLFHTHRTEHSMLRYLRHLADKDLALDRTMIPLGSCTMKLNATTEMVPISWNEFRDIHPFAPIDQVEGYMELIRELEADLAAITGYAAVSLQPNAGSQGEMAGLLAIRAYHRSRGEGRRIVCLIPASAHGTNAASAVMAGMQVVVVACDGDGNVDLDDLRTKAESAADRLAAVMITYPSTHGVFEPRVRELCDVVHRMGGQVYIDGANLNAMVGLAQPGAFGGDVSHLNLHKTFTIPHGGGGPGVGPIGVAKHLAPFLPGHPLAGTDGPDHGIGPVAAAPWGSAGILPIPWTYIRMMGADGLKRASEIAILSANYVASRLNPHFPVLYHGVGGRVAHECVLDLRPIARATGITAEDVAKRLADYGFHAPTLSFPVAGTLMVEPTESEPLAELDRFCEAMISIREEVRKVESGEWPADDNPLKNAPHPAEDLLKDGWSHPYSREVAAYPVARLRLAKYWPPVGRIDGASGDRNLVCACPPMEDYM